jgi:hypothetical protein
MEFQSSFCCGGGEGVVAAAAAALGCVWLLLLWCLYGYCSAGVGTAAAAAGGGGGREEEEEVSLGVIMTNTSILFQYFSYLFTIQLNFPPYFPYLFTFQLTFLPYFPYHFTCLPYFPYHFTIVFCIFQIFSLFNLPVSIFHNFLSFHYLTSLSSEFSISIHYST